MFREFLTSNTIITPQIDILLFLQNMREITNGVFDGLFLNITCFGELLIPFTVMCLIYWCFDPKAGMFLFSLNGVAEVLAQIFKTTACIYRPWILSEQIHPQANALVRAGGYSFPSGHATMASSSFGGMAYLVRKHKLFCALLVFLVLGVCLSRLYLGVHLPQDVIIGFLTGFILILPSIKLLDWCEKDKKRYICFLVVFNVFSILTLIYMCIKGYPLDYISGKLLVSPISAKYTGIIHTGLSMGAINGSILCRLLFPFEPKNYTKKAKILIGLIGIILALIIFYFMNNDIWDKICDFKIALIASFFSTFFLTGIYPLVFTKFAKEK